MRKEKKKRAKERKTFNVTIKRETLSSFLSPWTFTQILFWAACKTGDGFSV